MAKRTVNWVALVLLTVFVFGWAFGPGVDGAGSVVLLVLAFVTACYLGRRMFGRRDRRMML